MNFRRFVPARMGWHLMLALLMLLVQQAGLRHHLLEHGPSHEEAAPTHAACLVCLAHHAHGHSVAGAVVATSLAPPLNHVHSAAIGVTHCPAGNAANYRARAPPLVFSA